jgi:hypothetical protein
MSRERWRRLAGRFDRSGIAIRWMRHAPPMSTAGPDTVFFPAHRGRDLFDASAGRPSDHLQDRNARVLQQFLNVDFLGNKVHNMDMSALSRRGVHRSVVLVVGFLFGSLLKANIFAMSIIVTSIA